MTGTSRIRSMGATAEAHATKSGSAQLKQSFGDPKAHEALPEVPAEDAIGLGIAALAGYLFSVVGSPLLGGIGLAAAAAVAFLL